MIKKVYAERYLMSGLSMHVIYSIAISGDASVENLKIAIDYAVNSFESLRCRILQDADGEAYYIMRENRCSPYIEVRDYRVSEQEFLYQQQRIPFRYDKGELVRFYIEKTSGDLIYLRMVLHHLGGDGKSGLLLIDSIMKNLQEIDENRFEFVDKKLIPLQQISKKYIDEKITLSDLIQAYSSEINRKWEEEKVVFEYDNYLEMFKKFWDTHNTKLMCARIGKNVLESVHKSAKEKGVSINSVLVTAIAKNFVNSEKIIVVVDAIPEGYHRMGNFAGALDFDSIYDTDKSFWDNAIYLHNQIHTRLKERSISLFGSAMKTLVDSCFCDAINYYEAGCYQNLLVKEYDDMFGGAHMPIIVSNIGNFKLPEKGYGRFAVEEIQFGSPLIPIAECNMGVVSVNSHMMINMEYNPDYKINFEVLLRGVVKQLYELADIPEEDECILSL